MKVEIDKKYHMTFPNGRELKVLIKEEVSLADSFVLEVLWDSEGKMNFQHPNADLLGLGPNDMVLPTYIVNGDSLQVREIT